MRGIQRDHREILFGERFQIAGRLILMNLQLQAAVFIGQAIGFRAHDFQLTFQALRLNIFPDAETSGYRARRS